VNVQVNPADVWARAIIAAARSFGDDPVEAVVAPPARGRAGKRRSVAAAVLGISEAAGVPVERVAQVLGLRPSSVRVRKMRPTRDFRAAWRASARAAQYALWRPEAAESALGSASGDLDLAGLRTAAMGHDVMVRVAEALAPAPVADWEAELAQAVEALTEPPPHIARPHAPVAGRVNLANGHAFAPTFRPGPPPPTQSLEGRILARLAVAPGSPRGLASILDIKEAFVAQTLRNLGREGRVTAADLAPGQSDRDQAWRVA
jgi:hypothetical protein